MKFSAAFSLLISGAVADVDVTPSIVPGQRDGGPRRHGAHMWMFGSGGVQIFTPDGATEVKSIPPEKACKETTNSDGSTRVRCDFMDVVSDGRKYVWSSVARGVPMIDVFRIDTGDLVGSFATCGSPNRMDYHPLREEVWVHCSEFSDTTESHLDVFSAVNPAASVPATIALHDNTALRSFGRLVVDSELGDSAFSTVYGHKNLYKINMAERRVTEEYDVAPALNPKFYGLYDMAFSPKNGHLFIRSEVCCTCGFEGADSFECGRYGSGNITLTIDNEEVVTEGQCGRHCRGGPTDTIGVIEFDAASGKVVGEHPFVGSAPVYQPFSSPDGEHVVMFGMNGGKTAEILKAGSAGFKSTLDAVLTLDFNTTNVEDVNVFDDFAYIQRDGMNLFVVSSSSDYKVAIVDMDDPNKKASYVMLKDVPYTGRARGRQVEHVEGTDYVWIAGREDDEVYVINVATKELVKTFTEVDGRKLVSVKHHAFFEQAQDYASSSAFATSAASASTPSAASASTPSAEPADGGGNSDTLAIGALILSCVAIAAVMASFWANSNQGGAKSEALPLTQTKNSAARNDEASVQAPPSVN